MEVEGYNPESYWDEVAKNISDRKDIRIIAGDDEPFYRYKRKKFLTLLDQMNVEGKSVLEIGSGPGGNLKYLIDKKALTISGTDISSNMVRLSNEFLSSHSIEIKKTDGVTIPFETSSQDIVFSVTVLQHNVDVLILKKIIAEMCRISKSDIYIYERIEKKITGHESNTGRPVDYYAKLFKAEGFELTKVRFLNIDVSYIVCGIIRKLFNKETRKEGEPISKISEILQKVSLPITKLLDYIIIRKRDVAMLHFIKED